MSLYDYNTRIPHCNGEPDAHGQASLLLTESLLHVLVERSVLTVSEAVSVLQTAIEVKLLAATETSQRRERVPTSLDLLFRISDSFSTDLPEPSFGD